MAENPLSGILAQLTEVERAQYDALDKTPPPEDLLKEFRKPASVGWVKRYVDTHARYCPAVLLLRKYVIGALVVSVLSLALNVFRFVQDKTVIREAVHEAMAAEVRLSREGVRIGSEP